MRFPGRAQGYGSERRSRQFLSHSHCDTHPSVCARVCVCVCVCVFVRVCTCQCYACTHTHVVVTSGRHPLGLGLQAGGGAPTAHLCGSPACTQPPSRRACASRALSRPLSSGVSPLQPTINVPKNTKWRKNYSNSSAEIIGVDTCQQWKPFL